MAILTAYNNGQAIEIPALRGQRGPTGPTGLTGPQGLQGETGATGPQGKSAYQVAVDNGFSGTESEWLASLVGPQGPTGATGGVTLGPIASDNTTSAPSGKAVYDALQNVSPSLIAGEAISIGQDNSINVTYGEEQIPNLNLIWSLPTDNNIFRIETTTQNDISFTSYTNDAVIPSSQTSSLPMIGDPFGIINSSNNSIIIDFNYSNKDSKHITSSLLSNPSIDSIFHIPTYTFGDPVVGTNATGLTQESMSEDTWGGIIINADAVSTGETAFMLLFPTAWLDDLTEMKIQCGSVSYKKLPANALTAGKGIVIATDGTINAPLGTVLGTTSKEVWEDNIYVMSSDKNPTETYYGNLYAYDRNGGLAASTQIDSAYFYNMPKPIIYSVYNNEAHAYNNITSLRKNDNSGSYNYYMDIEFKYYNQSTETIRLNMVPSTSDLYNLNFQYKKADTSDVIFYHIYNASESLSDLETNKTLTKVDSTKICFALVVLWQAKTGIFSYVFLTPTNDFLPQYNGQMITAIALEQHVSMTSYNNLPYQAILPSRTIIHTTESLIFDRPNFITGEYNVLGGSAYYNLGGGYRNYISGEAGITGGQRNINSHASSLIIGSENISTASNQIICGSRNDTNSTALFQIGGNSNNRYNIFEVRKGYNNDGAYLGDGNGYYPYWNARDNKLSNITITGNETHEELVSIVQTLITALKNKGLMENS